MNFYVQFNQRPSNRTLHVFQLIKADPRLNQDIAYIYEILHCNDFIILTKPLNMRHQLIVVVL